ncbi:MAG: hypothetical protein K2W96_25235 [Gemmataceae bacterium]|nr:hypothetical protein [Gemmataceae bacterium]
MSRDPFDRFGDDEPLIRRTPAKGGLPGSVHAAGLIWVIFGSLILLVRVTDLVVTLNAQPGIIPQGNPMVAGAMVGTVGVSFVGLIFIVLGVLTLNGTLGDILAVGIISLIVGVLCGGVSGLGFVQAVALSSNPMLKMFLPAYLITLMFVVSGVGMLSGLAFLVAGILGLSGNEAYRRWRGRRLGYDPHGDRDRYDDYDDRHPRPRDDYDRGRDDYGDHFRRDRR